MKYDLIAEAYIQNTNKAVLKNGVIIAMTNPLRKSQLDESKIIHRYTVDGSKVINPHLFNAFVAGKEPEPHPDFDTEKMDSDLKEESTKERQTLYSGVPWNPTSYNSKIVHLPAYTSTSLSSHVASTFSPHVLEIDTNGFDHTDAQQHSAYQNVDNGMPEQEHILPRNTTLELTGEQKEGVNILTGEKHTRWSARIIAQGNNKHEETRTAPESISNADNTTAEQNEYAIRNAKTTDTLIKLAQKKNLNRNSIDLLATHPENRVKQEVVKRHDVPVHHLLNMVNSGVEDLELNKTNVKHPDNLAHAMLSNGLLPTAGISDEVYAKHKDSLPKDFYSKAALTDKQFNDAPKESLFDNKRLTPKQSEHQLVSGNPISKQSIDRLVITKNFPFVPEEKRQHYSIDMKHLSDFSDAELKKLSHMVKLTVNYSNNADDSMKLFSSKSKLLPNLIAQPHERTGGIHAGHILLASHPDLTPESLEALGTTKTNDGNDSVAKSLPALVLRHPNMTRAVAKKIIDKNAGHPYMSSMLRSVERLKK